MRNPQIGQRALRQGRYCIWLSTGLLSLQVLPLFGQFSVPWHSIAGGGATSRGIFCEYSVSGIIGQAHAGTANMEGGGFALAGGFLSLYAIQTPGAPQLTVGRTAPLTVTVSWPLTDGWTLQHAPAPDSKSWSQVSPPYQTNASKCWIDVAAPTGNRYYRLFKP